MVGGKFFKDSDEIVFPCKRQHGKFYDDLN